MVTFTDDDLKRLKENLVLYGVDPGIDVCNYFDDALEISGLVDRLEAAEACAARFQDVTPEDTQLFNAWLKSKGEK